MVNSAFEKKLIIDSKRNVWLFYLKAGGRIGCIVKLSRGDMVTAHPDLDETVIEYDIMVDERDNIHVLALTSEQSVIYMRRQAKGWQKFTLYSFSGKPILVSNLKAVAAADNLHLFYVYSEKGGSSALFHHQWTGSGWKGYRVFDMPNRAGNICYDADFGKDKGLGVAAAVGKSLSLWEFDGFTWMQSTMNKNSLWENTDRILYQQGCILVKSGQGVFFVKKVDSLDGVQPEKIIDARHVDGGPVLIDRKNTLYAAWVEGGTLGYRASYDGGASWGRVKYYHHAQGEKLEAYGFSNTFSLLINAKRILATSPPEIHIPFLHRSVERIRMPKGIFDETESGGYSAVNPISDSGEYGGDESGRGGAGRCDSDGGQCDCNTKGDMACSCHAVQDKDTPSQGHGEEIKRVREELEELIKRAEAEVRERLVRLEAELADIRGKLEGSGKSSRPPMQEGSIITQDMINRYMRRK
jgi:hypothetical protein